MDDYLVPLYHIYQQINVKGDIYKECSEECNMLYKVVTYQIYNIRFFLSCQKAPHKSNPHICSFFCFHVITSNAILKALIFPSSELSGSAFLMREVWFKSVYLRHDISAAPPMDVERGPHKKRKATWDKGFPTTSGSTPNFHPTAGLFPNYFRIPLRFYVL